MASLNWLSAQARTPKMQALYDQALVSGVNFVTLVYLGRRFDTDAFGYFMLAYMSVVGIAALHTAMVTQPFNLVGAARAPARNIGHLHALLRLHALAWLPASVAVIALLGLAFFPDARLALAASVYLCLFLLQELLRRYWYTSGELRQAFANDFISYGLQLPLLLWLGTSPGFDGASAFYIMALTSALALLHGWHRLRDKPAVFMPVRELFGLHRTTGFWLALAALSAYGATQLYPYMLAGVGAGAVAAFAAARNVLNALNVIVQAANNYLPIKSKRTLEHEGAPQMSRLLWRAGIQIGAVAAAFCLAVTLVSSDLLFWIYGKSFAGGQVLPLLAVGAFAAALFPVLSAGILALERAPVIFISNLAATLFNLSIGWWLIARFGVNGAAIAASLSLVLVLAIQSWRLHGALIEFPPGAGGKPCLP